MSEVVTAYVGDKCSTMLVQPRCLWHILGNSVGSGAKSIMTNDLLMDGEDICAFSSCIKKPFLIYDFAPDPIWISLYMRKIFFSFLSVYV